MAKTPEKQTRTGEFSHAQKQVKAPNRNSAKPLPLKPKPKPKPKD